MSKVIADMRDQKFVLFEMLKVDSLLKTDKYKDFSLELFDMTLELAERMGEEVLLPILKEGDREGCTLNNGSVSIPKCYHYAHKVISETGLFTMGVSPEAGGQGFPFVIDCACREYFVANMGFFLYPEAAVGAAHMIEVFGTAEQKSKYMEKMYAGQWGGTMVLTEPEAGSDVGNIKARAVKQVDGSYRIFGNKIFISGGDNDLYENIVHAVLARIEGDPEGTSGISIFLVPKYMPNANGTLGKRNDYAITSLEHKMGIKGSATCGMSFGDNGECYAELLGTERQGMKIMFQMMNEARLGMGIQGTGTASVAYLHSLKYSKERIQGKKITEMSNPDAKNTAIINHPDVRRMLLWMKSHVEGMRAMLYLCAYAMDNSQASLGAEVEKWHGIMEILIPVCKSFNTDMGFKVCELAVQIHGGYGYCSDFPVEQFLRDLKIGSIYEGTNGIQALDLVGRKLGQKNGANAANLIAEMNKTIAIYGKIETLAELAEEVQKGVNTLGEVGMLFMQANKTGKALMPILNATSFLSLMGNVCLAWLHLWQAGVAQEKLNSMAGADNSDAAFYQGKIIGARFYIINVLPAAIAIGRAIKKEDMSPITMPEECFG